ncbi:inner membrane complex protein 1b [Plasmodium berghei]|uniref:Inner membrane complex protein 1b n=1 Tax=Plasmodium berghei TaxID=5821 RepID=A0A0Y9WI71_PLABE|nr:inner membrane complex protein 1b [Plasmodium berghei]SCM21810.1 inner membrane complex protein 1b [Plasmodium berghei]SCN25059.1 inner membrane complex protein 1b [Plasmodium berghei]SCO60088.1 inner membrane complex protein 1b [Plasmodium berghei]
MKIDKNKSASISNHDNEMPNMEKLYDQLSFQKFENESNSSLKYSEIDKISSLNKSTQSFVYSNNTNNSYANTSKSGTRIMNKPNVHIVEKIKEVPTYIVKNQTRIIDVPELRFVNKIEHDTAHVIEKLKYVPKDVTKYNIIKKPVIKNIVKEKKMDVLHVQEKISFRDQEVIEEVYNYVDKDGNKIKDHNDIMTMDYNLSNENESNRKIDYPVYPSLNCCNNTSAYIENSNNICSMLCDNKDENTNIIEKSKRENLPYDVNINMLPPLLEPFGPQIKTEDNKIFENVFVPKVEKIVEVQKKIDIPINLPVPYIVPKPKIIDVDIPVFKFNDKYVPVPVRQKIIPKVTWSDKVYKIDCIIEKPYLVYHDIIKFVPTDTKINIREYPKGINKINPEELYEADNLALWMRVNADLKEEKDKLKKNTQSDSMLDHICECSDCETCEHISNSELNISHDLSNIKYSPNNFYDTIPLHQDHPLEMVHLQNKWMKKDTTKIPELYNEQFMNAHRNAFFNLTSKIPREAKVEMKTISQLKTNT